MAARKKKIYYVVSIDDGHCEWSYNFSCPSGEYCIHQFMEVIRNNMNVKLVSNNRRRSTKESGLTVNQQLKAEIRAISDIITEYGDNGIAVDFSMLKQRLRELSAV